MKVARRYFDGFGAGRHDRSRECHVIAMRGLEVAAQRNAQSTSPRLKTLGMVGVPYKRLETLFVLTVDSKRVEARRIAAEYSVS